MAKHKYNYYLISSESDFYIADSLCRELEKKGFYCFYNIRDSKKKDKTPDKFFNFAEDCTIITIVDYDFVEETRYVAIFDKLMEVSDYNFLLLKNGKDFEIPEKWKNLELLDVSEGLNREIVSIVTQETVNPELNQSISSKPTPSTSLPKEQSKPKEEDVPSIVSESILSPFSTGSNLPIEKTEPISHLADTTIATSASSSYDMTEDTQDEGPQNVEKEDKEDFIKRVRESHSKLRTVMTTRPTNTDDDAYFERVSEAYLVPLYILPFERCENIPDPSYLFGRVENPSMTLQRAFRYLEGNGVPQDSARAFSLFQKALNDTQSDVEAKYCMAVCYEAGIGVDVSRKKAIQLYREAHLEGFLPASSHLGFLLYQSGETVEAESLLKDSHNKGELEASYALGVIAEDKKDYPNALEYYSEAAELGHQKAQNAISAMYYNGVGVSRNETAAMQWLEQAKTSNFNGAIYNTIVHELNKIDKAIPNMEALQYIESLLTPLDDEMRKLHEVLKMPGIYYNFAILVRRRNAPIDVFNGWFSLPKYCRLPYVDEFYSHYEAEKKRRSRNAVGYSVLNGLNWLLDNMQGTSSESIKGGLFDKKREI